MSDKSIQDQIGMAESFEEALRLITENPPQEGKKNIQPISMSLITAEPELFQGRQGLNQEGLSDYREALKDGAKFPPLVVYCDTSNYKFYLVDGYHRHTLYKECGYRWAECNVLFGTKEEAIEYAVSANVATHGIRLNETDKKKAAFMLFSLPGWVAQTNRPIAKKIGCSAKSAERWRSEYCAKNKVDFNTGTVVRRIGKDGSVKVCKKPRSVREVQDAINRIRLVKSNKGHEYYRVNVNAQAPVHLGKNLDEAIAKVKTMFEAGDFFVGKKIVSSPSFGALLSGKDKSQFRVWLHKRGVVVSHVTREKVDSRSIQLSDIYDYSFDSGVIKICAKASQESFSRLVGDVLLASSVHPCKSPRKVIISEFPGNCAELIAMAAKVGIECLTPDEFVATFPKLDAESA